MDTMLEPVGCDLDARISSVMDVDEEILMRVSSDLNADGTYGQQWVIVSNRRILVLQDDDAIEIPLEDLKLAHTEPLVGGSRLELERVADRTILIPYSFTQALKFSELARGIEQIRKSEPFAVRMRLDRVRCEKCNRLLPERDGICPACINRLVVIGRIAKYLSPYRGRALLLALGSVLTTGAELVPPLITKKIVDDVLIPQEVSPGNLESVQLLGLLVLALVGMRIVSWGAEWLHGWTITWLGARVTADIRSQLYKCLELLSLQFYDKRKVGALMSRVTRDTDRLQDFLVDGIPYLIINGLMLLGILVMLFVMSWKLTLYVLIPVPFIILWGMIFWKRMRRFFTKWMQGWSNLMSRVNEALTGIKVVKAFTQESREIEVFGKGNAELTEVAVKSEINRAVFFTTMSFLTGLGVLIVWLFGGEEVIAGELTIGTLLAFYSYMWLLYGPLEWFGMVNSWMTRAFAGAERIFEVIDTPPEAYEDPKKAVSLPEIKGSLRFKDVTFGYDKSKPVLHEINLNVREGEMIGLVGKSGVGKTTTVNLICRFYEVDRGSIEVDGVNIRKIRLEDLRSQIGIVLQEPFLFSGTIAENIGYGKPGATFTEIMEAAVAANAHDFIVANSDGYDTQVGERGSHLSGGEKQRVSLARAILNDPKVLILDEATSSVDVQTEKKIQEAIGHLVKGRTTFAIAHRLSTLRNADRLVVLDGGRIVEVGTHAELMEKQGVFYNLVQLQQEVSEIIAVKE